MRLLSSRVKRSFFAIIVAVLFSSLISYVKVSNNRDRVILLSSAKIKSILIREFEYVEKTLKFTGNKIANDTPDLKEKIILKALVESAYIYPGDGIFSWSVFDWVNEEGYQTVNTTFGVREEAHYVASDRRYRHKGNKNWEMIFCDPVLGNTSNTLVIPIGMQIETSKNKYAGSVVLGIDVNRLVSIISYELDQNIHFEVIDKRNDKPAFGSVGYDKVFDEKNYLESGSYEVIDLDSAANVKYPYRVLVSYDKSGFWREVYLAFLSLSLQILATAFVVFILLRKRGK